MEEDAFENIDIQPEIRIPKPRQPFWIRCWQPIGTTIMDTGVLKEPRGFMRILELLFAIVAFATCADFSTYMEYTVPCDPAQPISVRHNFSYPFALGDGNAVPVQCGKVNSTMTPPGDFSSDAKFFVFTGVVSFLSTIAILVVYVFFSGIYSSESKRGPQIDFFFTVVVAVFWLSASAAWANGLNGMKSVLAGNWIKDPKRVCVSLTPTCQLLYTGAFAGANISVIVGFLNFFLWSANLWFLYKETSWFVGRSQQMGGNEASSPS